MVFSTLNLSFRVLFDRRNLKLAPTILQEDYMWQNQFQPKETQQKQRTYAWIWSAFFHGAIDQDNTCSLEKQWQYIRASCFIRRFQTLKRIKRPKRPTLSIHVFGNPDEIVEPFWSITWSITWSTRWRSFSCHLKHTHPNMVLVAGIN